MIRKMISQLLLILLLFAGCASGGDQSSNGDAGSTTPIRVEGPMTLSNTMFTGYQGENLYIRVRMVSGRYYEDWAPGANMGTLHEGSYCFEIANEAGKVLKRTEVGEFTQGTPLLFKFPFDLILRDYNGDGDLEFTLGQYACSNGCDFKIFTIKKDYSVEVLPVKDRNTLYISGGDGGYYSVLLESRGKDAIRFQYYDQSKGRYILHTYRWTSGKAFELVKSEEKKGE